MIGTAEPVQPPWRSWRWADPGPARRSVDDARSRWFCRCARAEALAQQLSDLLAAACSHRSPRTKAYLTRSSVDSRLTIFGDARVNSRTQPSPRSPTPANQNAILVGTMLPPASRSSATLAKRSAHSPPAGWVWPREGGCTADVAGGVKCQAPGIRRVLARKISLNGAAAWPGPCPQGVPGRLAAWRLRSFGVGLWSSSRWAAPQWGQGL